MVKKTKKTLVPWVAGTKEEMLAAISQMGQLQRDLTRVKLEMDEKIAAIKDAFQSDINEKEQAIEQLFHGIGVWCETHRNELLTGDAKSVDLVVGTVGWRQCPPSVKVTSLEKAITFIKANNELSHFLNFTPELKKQALLADIVNAKKVPGIKIGLSSEVFSVEPAGDNT